MWYKAILMGHPMRLKLTREGLLVKLANHYNIRGDQENLTLIRSLPRNFKKIPVIYKYIVLGPSGGVIVSKLN